MKGWRFWLGLVIGIAALVYFSFDLEVAAIAQTWRKIDPVWFLLGIFFFCFSFWLRCPRWKILAHDLGEVTLNLMTKAFFVGMLVNRIFPARLGELARCVVLKRKAGISLIGLLATVAAEKAFDALALLTVTLLAISALPTEGLPPAFEALLEEHRRKVMIGALGLPLVLLITAWMSPVVSLLLKNRSERWDRYLESLGRGLAIFRSGGHTLGAAGFTVLVWGTLVLSEYCTLRSFGWDLSPWSAVVLCAGIGIAVSVPQAPSFVGVYQLAVQWVLEDFYRVDVQEAKAFAVAIWVTQIVPVGAIGFVCLRLLGTSLREATLEERPD
jgi:hypothetical protein